MLKIITKNIEEVIHQKRLPELMQTPDSTPLQLGIFLSHPCLACLKCGKQTSPSSPE